MEVDFDNGQVCVASLCMPVERLSAIGKVRLKHLLQSAFRELDPAAEATGARAVKPARAGVRLAANRGIGGIFPAGTTGAGSCLRQGAEQQRSRRAR